MLIRVGNLFQMPSTASDNNNTKLQAFACANNEVCHVIPYQGIHYIVALANLLLCWKLYSNIKY